jgi:hypothetical protein
MTQFNVKLDIKPTPGPGCLLDTVSSMISMFHPLEGGQPSAFGIEFGSGPSLALGLQRRIPPNLNEFRFGFAGLRRGSFSGKSRNGWFWSIGLTAELTRAFRLPQWLAVTRSWVTPIFRWFDARQLSLHVTGSSLRREPALQARGEIRYYQEQFITIYLPEAG